MSAIEPYGPDFGHALDSVIIERGLRELCPGLHFDLAAATNQVHPFINDRQGVYYEGRHICALDRGMVPEYKMWATRKVVVPCEWWEADKDDASIQYESVLKSDPSYQDLYEKAVKGSDPAFFLRADGRLIRCKPMKYQSVRAHVIRVGWRHTFERLLMQNLPGITREALAKKFGVDMTKLPLATPEEVLAAVGEE